MIFQLRDSFKDLKKRFSNLKLSFLKRNEGSRNVKATRNQLQQVELYEEKLQVGPAAACGLEGLANAPVCSHRSSGSTCRRGRSAWA